MNHRRPAFTLIELLVVVAILGALLAIMVPTITTLRRRAEMAGCATNLAQFGRAALQYANQWTRLLPSMNQMQGYGAEGQYFFRVFVGMDPDRFQKAYRSAPLDTYGKCPSLVRFQNLGYEAVSSDPTKAYNFVYHGSNYSVRSWFQVVDGQYIHGDRGAADNLGTYAYAQWNTRMHQNLALLLCGTGKLNRSDGMTQAGGPQYPHLVTQNDCDGVPTGGTFNQWYTKGLCNALQLSGRVAPMRNLVRTSSLTAYDDDRYILIGGAGGGSPAWKSFFYFWQGFL